MKNVEIEQSGSQSTVCHCRCGLVNDKVAEKIVKHDSWPIWPASSTTSATTTDVQQAVVAGLATS